MTQKIYQWTDEKVLTQTKSNAKDGLTTKEAEQRLAKDGPNQLQSQKKTSWLQKFMAQFNDFMIIVLLVAALISFVMGMSDGEGPADAIIILLVVILNAIMGVIQESKAEEAIDALQEMASPEATVRRDGQVTTIKAHDLVVGDLVLLEAGSVVPADLYLLETNSLQIEEAALTGESVPVEKEAGPISDDEVSLGDRLNLAYSSTNVTYGRGIGVVIATGMDTEVGHIAHLLAQTKQQKTPLQRDQDQLGKVLTWAILIIAVVTFCIGVFLRGIAWNQMLLIAISLAVAAIPEGLPAISTIILSLGTRSMAERQALVRTLPAVETLGGVDVICSDKTGTLTMNQMTVEQVYYNGQLQLASDSIPEDAMLWRSFVWANDTQIDADNALIGDPTETALVQFAQDQAIPFQSQLELAPRLSEIPFDSTRKLMSTIHPLEDGDYLIATKGAPDQLLNRCRYILCEGEVTLLTDDKRAQILQANETMSKQALRVLAGAVRFIEQLPEALTSEAVEEELIFTGLVGLIDPERQEAADSIAQAQQAGIRTVMITGDHALTAQAIAERLGILDPDCDNSSHVLTGAQLDQLSEDELIDQVANYSVYARVSPEHKVRIIKAWQANDKVVAMTGDGVNDAPSLKQADIGVGMGITGTEVSKGASDMVLADDNFKTIVAAVEEGRKVFGNIQKAIQYLLSANLGEVLTLFIATLLGWTILEPVHILWINVVTDVFPAIALGLEQAEPNLMARQPRGKSSSFLDNGILPSIIYQGILEGGITLFVYWYSRFQLGVELNMAETIAFITLSLIQLFHAYNMKSVFHSIFNGQLFNNKYLNLAFLLSGTMLFGVVLIPGVNQLFDITIPNRQGWLLILVASLSLVVFVELIKWLFRITGKADQYEHLTHE